MFVQVENLKLSNYNLLRSTEKNVIKDIRERGWKIMDCKITELKDDLVKAVYRSPDGKNTIAARPNK